MKNEKLLLRSGNFADYRQMAKFHYCKNRPYTFKRIHSLLDGDKVVAVIVISYPFPQCNARSKRWNNPKHSSAKMKRINSELELISRIIVRPAYRNTGLALRLLKHAKKHSETKMIECIARPKLKALFKKAGFKTTEYLNSSGQRKLYALRAFLLSPFRLNLFGCQTMPESRNGFWFFFGLDCHRNGNWRESASAGHGEWTGVIRLGGEWRSSVGSS